MTQKTITLVTCDLHESEKDANKNDWFAFSEGTYELDFCPQHYKEFIAAMKEWASFGTPVKHKKARRQTRRATNGAATRKKRTETTATERTGATPTEVRTWAREQGYVLSDRGRIPANVMQAYTDAH